eukprot:CAMPEP_0172501662 /NCGR_PEP_ID=MMETSP1066-20121228/152036_1 /TAXON_ID=671091 /ORGANISM="Coscinodiscus wailesii, Strain CCMP2513" /LENGTH=425 /DNA_ID=CAMNT_0013276579 /DNA_START=329 /DNA_END=1606 /DNA_ORIENTATION=+
MEMLVMARVLSRPEPPLSDKTHSFYVSKTWCRAALQWLEVQMPSSPPSSPSKKKLSKKQRRRQHRKLSDVSPPWPNVNDDLTCTHANLRHCSGKSARARRRVMDRQAWRVLRKLYPDSVTLGAFQQECPQCALEKETTKFNEERKKEVEKRERKKPLGNASIRGFYTRTKGVPGHCLVADQGGEEKRCPLMPGIYHALPRAWCHKWRKYVKTGEGHVPHAPDAASLLCDAHRLPLVPPHLMDFITGSTNTLFVHKPDDITPPPPAASAASAAVADTNNDTSDNDSLLATMGFLTLDELEAQKAAMNTFFQQRAMIEPGPASRCITPTVQRTDRHNQSNHDLLDQENCVVVEILTDDEFTALETWWPEIHSSFVLTFAICEAAGTGGRRSVDVTWSTPPCQLCDAGHPTASYVTRNRNRKWFKKAK